MIKRQLEKEVEKLLSDQAKIDEKTEKLINRFLEENEKVEIYALITLIHENGAPKHIQEIDKFRDGYEKNSLCTSDIKTYLTLQNIHKGKFKTCCNNDKKEDCNE